jgi:hypothetical protein
MENKRKQCKECPWRNENQHSLKFRDYAKKMNSVGKIQNSEHACHMITSDVWGFKSEINQKNVCIGACKN